MSDKGAPLKPVVKKRRGISMVWLIPAVTLCVGIWLIVKTVSEMGPEITITFRTAAGIEAGKTVIKYKDIPVGLVESVRFGDDGDHVILTARLDREADSFLHRDTRFWVVRPKLSLRGASGLSTLISGSFIEMDPGHGSPQTHFTGLDDAPAVTSETDGANITLISDKLGSLDVGSPVYYQGIEVGEILGYELANDQHSVLVHTFVRSPYDQRVHGNSHFWNISGIDLTMGADGVSLRTSSLQSVMYGGIAFDSPKSLDGPDVDTSTLIYTLYGNFDEVIANAQTRKLRFVTYFKSSVRGLEIGAPVEFKGIKVGKVADLSLQYDSDRVEFRIPIVLEIEPELIFDRSQSEDEAVYKAINELIDHGLRAQLQTGSLLTGKLFVALDLHPESTVKLVADASVSLPEIPSIAGEFDQITTSVQHILAKLEKVPTDKIGVELHRDLVALRPMMESLGDQVEPVVENLDLALVQARKTLENIDKVLDPASPMQHQLNRLSHDLSNMARSIRAFIDLLERHPNAVIVGKPAAGDSQ